MTYDEILTKHILQLTKELNPNEALFEHLMARDVMQACDREKINKRPTRGDRALELVEYMMTRGQEALPTFLYALENSSQGHLAKLLAKDAAPLYFEGEKHNYVCDDVCMYSF